MLTAEGCQSRRRRFLEQLNNLPEGGHIRLADPLHLNYLAGFHIDPVSLNAGFGAVLILRDDGYTKLLHDDRLRGPAAAAFVEERQAIPWYDGQSPGKGPRQLACYGVNPAIPGGLRIHDRPGDPFAPQATGALAQMRRVKGPDEVALLRQCMKATEAGHAWARAHLKPGMTELDVYSGVCAACYRAAGRPVVVYGDFAVSPGPERRGGPPTSRVLQAGDLFILDFSVVLNGYRSDFTNTLAVGGAPSSDQRHHFDLCLQAMAAGEKQLRAGSACQAVFDAVNGVFQAAGTEARFGHHAGHGIGLTHPEAPFFVRHSEEVLLAGDVVTLEPGQYVPGAGGMRIEHNYLITEDGYERLSSHDISLV
jgi:methionine aminopeptidase